MPIDPAPPHYDSAAAPKKSAPLAYAAATRTATYGFLSALPLLVIYEVAIVLANYGRAAQVRVGADVWIKQALAVFGDFGYLAVAVATLAVGVAVFYAERHARPPLRPRYFGLMVAESAVYAVVFAILVSGFVGWLLLMAPAAASGATGAAAQTGIAGQGLFASLALSIGAGLYEELVFRVILVGGLYLLLRRLAPQMSRPAAYVASALVGALLFSAVHYVGVYGDDFTLASFTFRFVFGLVFNAIFLVRGFGVAAWTHALYDVFVVTGLLG
jgi:membrane protease YdiL (CAAX protease family)